MSKITFFYFFLVFENHKNYSKTSKVLHSAVDSVERDQDKGSIRGRIRLKTGRIINLLMVSEFELDAFAQSVQLLSAVDTRDSFPFKYQASDEFEDLDEVVIATTQQWFKENRFYENLFGKKVNLLQNIGW